MVFTKYDQFKRDIEMDLQDGDHDTEGTAHEILFQENYLCHLDAGAKYVQLESEFREWFFGYVPTVIC